MNESITLTPVTPYVTPTTEEFLALPKAERRHAIARDVPAQLDAQTIVAETSSCYFRLPLRKRDTEKKLLDRQLQEVLANTKQKCTVCGLGACFVSAVRLGNHLALDEDVIEEGFCLNWHTDRNEFTLGRADQTFENKLLEHFSVTQIAVIESAFEAAAYNDTPSCVRAAEFGHNFKTGEERLRAIMNAILADPNGEFHPVKAGK